MQEKAMHQYIAFATQSSFYAVDTPVISPDVW